MRCRQGNISIYECKENGNGNTKEKILSNEQLPAPNSDFYEFAETLPAEELAVVKQVRAFMETKVAPIITKYWVDDAFSV